VGAAGLLLELYLVFRGLHWTLDRWAKDWKLHGQEDWASLAVLLLLLQVLLFVSSPVISGYSRMQETCRGRLWIGSNPRVGSEFGRGRRARVSDYR